MFILDPVLVMRRMIFYLVLVIGLIVFVIYMVRMPGNSYQAALPPLDEAGKALDCRVGIGSVLYLRHVRRMASELRSWTRSKRFGSARGRLGRSGCLGGSPDRMAPDG